MPLGRNTLERFARQLPATLHERPEVAAAGERLEESAQPAVAVPALVVIGPGPARDGAGRLWLPACAPA